MTDITVTARPPANPWRAPTWLCALSPLLALALLGSTALHMRWAFGGWPTNAVDDPPTFLLSLHQVASVTAYLLCPFVATPLWAVLLCFRHLRLGFPTHLIQALVLTGGLATLVSLPALVPAKYFTWMLD